MNYQEQPSWCGIACLDMVSNYFLPGWDDTTTYQYTDWLGHQQVAPTQPLSYLWYESSYTNPADASAQSFIQMRTNTPTYSDRTGPGLDVGAGANFLYDLNVGSDVVQAANWHDRLRNAANDVFDIQKTSIESFSPIIYRVNTKYLQAWTTQTIHYVVACGIEDFDVNDHNNNTASIDYNDPYPGLNASYPPYPETPGNTNAVVVSDPVGAGMNVTVTEMYNALMYSDPYAINNLGYNSIGGYVIYNSSTVPSGESVALAKSVTNLQNTIIAQRAKVRAARSGVTRVVLHSATQVKETDPTAGATTSPHYVR